MSAPAESSAKLGDGPAGIPQPVLVRGTGLLGASIGIGLSAAGVDVRLHDPSPAALAVAADIRAGRPARLDAEGDDLDDVLGATDLAAGDFVRWMKQLLDLCGQVADAAGDSPLRSTARAAAKSLKRGVIAYSVLAE